ncbi:molybdopterin oxidoreductase [Dactylosporangium sp. NPDC051541]|uniref:molybdopterin oxidoreductase n=1 Tax=Dactylosporangium sp. NPDC051541 TaxID=3363977 RepID=UPI0037BAEE23
MRSTPRFLQGVYSFEGKGLDAPALLDAALSYVVPDGVTAQTVYLRAGNAAPELVYLVLVRDGQPMRYFPIGAKSSTHVALRVVEDLDPGTEIALHAAAPAGVGATVVVDLGLVEVA